MTALTLATGLGHEQRLALAYAPRTGRTVFAGLFALDRLLGQAITKGREPLAAQLRLAWWREELAAASPATSDWRIAAVLEMWRHDRAPLLAMVDGWEELTAAHPDWSACVARRAFAFEALARDWGCEADRIPAVGSAARLWLLLDLGDHLTDEAEKAAVRGLAGAGAPPGPLPRKMRPLAVLAGLAQHALTHDGPMLGHPFSPLVAIRLGIFGR